MVGLEKEEKRSSGTLDWVKVAVLALGVNAKILGTVRTPELMSKQLTK